MDSDRIRSTERVTRCVVCDTKTTGLFLYCSTECRLMDKLRLLLQGEGMNATIEIQGDPL